ncbi:aldehyde dehydrogenase (NADP(+)) [Namhaeicola litoreus]|uniref:Aldehyde dehydrogenase (NADP(+)) n=1 Tax=Namhaeicola litoreus TaxID=1052145 RepID=A0ABW3XYN4_9FLAO
MITGKNFLGSELSAKGNKTYKTFNPQLNIENNSVFYEANEEEVNQAVQMASKAFQTYKDFSGNKRAHFLRLIGNEIEELGDELIKMYCTESGLPEGRALGERGRTIGQLNSFANLLEKGDWVDAVIDTANPERIPAPKEDIRRMNKPIGPVVVFGASNFPLAFSTAGGDTASALAAGCPVIVKSHPMHAGTSELVASAIISAAKKSNIPNGVFSHLNSSGFEVGQALVSHPLVKAVGFTGSYAGGKALFDLASKRPDPIPVFAEMGSVNPVIVLPSSLKAKSHLWAKAYANSIALGAGQFCTNPGLILALENENLNDFCSELSIQMNEIQASCMLHPNIEMKFSKDRNAMLKESHVKPLYQAPDQKNTNFARQTIATVKGQDFLHNKNLHHEVFGPFSMVVRCESEAVLISILKVLEGQLTGTILADEAELSSNHEIISLLSDKVGRIIFNSVPTGVEVCHAMVHGGPFPATTDGRFTSVGTSAIQRWVRPVCYQNWPNNLLPDELKNENPLGIYRVVNNSLTSSKI